MKKIELLIAVCFIFMVSGTKLSAHCDTMNGPVISAAKEALDKKDVNLVLIWVQPKDEALTKELFNQTLKLRTINPDVKKMADMHFFENLVRIHRSGEGFPYTGIKEEGEVELPIAAADKALQSGKADEVIKMLHESVDHGVKEKFKEMISRKNYPRSDVKAGREFVESYVRFMHYAEGIYNSAENKEEAHGEKMTTPVH